MANRHLPHLVDSEVSLHVFSDDVGKPSFARRSFCGLNLRMSSLRAQTYFRQSFLFAKKKKRLRTRAKKRFP